MEKKIEIPNVHVKSEPYKPKFKRNIRIDLWWQDKMNGTKVQVTNYQVDQFGDTYVVYLDPDLPSLRHMSMPEQKFREKFRPLKTRK